MNIQRQDPILRITEKVDSLVELNQILMQVQQENFPPALQDTLEKTLLLMREQTKTLYQLLHNQLGEKEK